MTGKGMGRRGFMTLAGGTLAGLAMRAAADEGKGRPGRPNIIYVFSDEHRYQSMSFTEMPSVRTPNMARMAREGFQFRQALSNYPVCSPYRAILMTGRWPHQTGIIDNNIGLKADAGCLGNVFRQAGYRTGYIGKWHLGGTRAEPFGFDHSLIWTNTNAHYDASQYHPAQGDPVQPKGYNATLMTDQALAFLEQAWGAPFLLVLSINPPHADFTDAPEDKRALYPPGSLPTRPNYVATENLDGRITGRNGSPFYEGYHAHITAVDAELGRVLDAVAASGEADNTLVIYTSDHGTMFGSHGVGSKRQPWEESIRVPFLVRGARGGVPVRGASSALFGAVDVLPTLCGLAGIAAPETCMGQDFSGHLFDDGGPDPECQLIMHISKDHASGARSHPAPIFRGLRTRTHTYFVLEDGSPHLFDNRADPFQQHDLAEQPDQAERCAALHAELGRRLAAAEDPFLEDLAAASV